MGFWKDLFNRKDYNEEFKKRIAKERQENKKVKIKEQKINKQVEDNKVAYKDIYKEPVEELNIDETIVQDNSFIRDKFIKDSQFFKNQIESIEALFKENKNKLIASSNPEEYHKFFKRFNIYSINKANCLFSLGAGRNELIPIVEDAFVAALDMWSSQIDYSDGGDIDYNYLLQMLSLGILLEIDNNFFQELLNVMDKYIYSDFIIDFLLNKNIPNERLIINDEISNLLRNAILNDREISEGEINLYLNDYFFSKQNLGEYCNIHRNNPKYYFGYWSWEAAAIVKIKGLNDRDFIDYPFYPANL